MMLFRFIGSTFGCIMWLAMTAQAKLDENTGHFNNSKVDNGQSEESDELRLFHHLMKNYDRDVRPMKNTSHPVVIRLGITLTQIFDLDEKNQVLTTSVWLDMEWYDEYLTWNPGDYGDIKSLRIPCEKIWLPDMVLYNNADDYTQGFMNSKAMVTHDGNVFWPPPTKLRSKCPVDVTFFPFDHQTCILKLGSWIYDGFQVDVTNRSTEVDMSNYVPNGEWELIKTTIKRNVVYYPCCPEPFPDVTITIVIQRRTLYYISNVVLPCMMMSALTLLVFRLPPDAGEKIALGFTVLLAFSVFMLTVAEKMPETSTSVPLIGMYLTAVMAITTVSIMMTVVVLNFHYRGPSKSRAPRWLKKLLLGKLGAFFCSDIVDDEELPPTCRRRQVAATPQSLAAILQSSQPSSRFLTESKDYQSSCNHSTEAHSRDSKTSYFGAGGGSGGGGGGCSVAGRSYESQQPCLTTVQQVELHSCSYHQEILRILQTMVDKEEQESKRMEVINEWRQMAAVIDRVLFWVFLIAIVVCSVVFLVVLPSHRHDVILSPTDGTSST